MPPKNQKEYNQQYYLANRERKIANTRRRQKLLLKEVRQLKLATGCQKCGYNKSARALTYHHMDDNKEHTIAKMCTQGHTLDNVKKEISKCLCLCMNCHAEIHELEEVP